MWNSRNLVIWGLGFEVAFLLLVRLVLLIWSYYMVVFQDPGSVPENWVAMLDEESFAGSSSIASTDATTTTENRNSMISPADVVERRPAVGVCSRCQNSKPPRCHHCSFVSCSLLLICLFLVYWALASLACYVIAILWL